MKVNYNKKFSNDGTVFTQTITVDKEIVKGFNKMLKAKREKVSKQPIFSEEDMKLLYWAEELKEGENYIGRTTFRYFISYYADKIKQKEDKDFKRVLFDRNTIIKVI